MDVPQSWLVRPREALYDLDNIQLGSLFEEDRGRGVEAVFNLDYLVVEGHARNRADIQIGFDGARCCGLRLAGRGIEEE